MRQRTYGGTDLRSGAGFTWHLKNIIMVPCPYQLGHPAVFVMQAVGLVVALVQISGVARD